MQEVKGEIEYGAWLYNVVAPLKEKDDILYY